MSEDTEGMVRELLDNENVELNSWEAGFIEDMEGKTTFSPNQAAKVSQIWHKNFG